MRIRYETVYNHAYSCICGDPKPTSVKAMRCTKYVQRMIRKYRARPLRDRFLFLRCLMTAVETQSIFESVDASVRDSLAQEIVYTERLVQQKLQRLQCHIANYLWRPDSPLVVADMHAVFAELKSALQSRA